MRYHVCYNERGTIGGRWIFRRVHFHAVPNVTTVTVPTARCTDGEHVCDSCWSSVVDLDTYTDAATSNRAFMRASEVESESVYV